MRIKILLISLFLFFTGLYSQKLSESTVYVDYSRFKYDSDSVYFELYYGISNKALKVQDNINEAEIKVLISDSLSSKIVGFRNFRIVSEAAQSENERYLTGVLGFKLYKGSYLIDFSVSDFFDSTNRYTVNFPIKINSISTKYFALSDIQLCSNIIENSDNKESYFYKNTYEAYPNPSNVFGEELPILFYYIELYDLLKDEPRNNLKFISKVIDAQGKER